MTTAATIAQGITDALNAKTFSQSFTAVRSYAPAQELKDLDTLAVVVIPTEETITPQDRNTRRREIKTGIAVQKRLNVAPNASFATYAAARNAAADPVLALATEIAAYLEGARLEVDRGAWAWQATEHDPLFLPDHLHESNLLTSIVVVTHAAGRTKPRS